MIELDFDVKGIDGLNANFDAAEKWIKRPFERGLSLKIRAIFNDEVDKQFKSKGAHFKTKWRPLSKDYKAWKDQEYPGRPLMVLTGKLKQSLMRANSRHAIFNVRRDRIILGTRVPYAKEHQLGTDKPRRPLVLIVGNGSMQKRWSAAMLAAFKKRFGNSNG